MIRWWHRNRRSPLCLALYAACFLIVLSFILFEVLDVDGSDFPVPTGRNATLRAATTEEHTDALRRAASITTSVPLVLVALVGLLTSSAAMRQHTPPTTAAGLVTARRYRTPLPRASLPAPAV